MCDYCEPWYNPKAIVETLKLSVQLVVKDDMYRYVRVLWKPWKKWHCLVLEPVDKCPICGKEA